MTPEGAKPIEELRPGDVVLARDEYDPAGPVEPKVVEELFVYESQVLYLTIDGERIGTTSEHPFFVVGRGWTKAIELRLGDELASHDAQNATLGAIEAGEWQTVYNIRVQDHNTYFVGCGEWGFSVWAHNACIYYHPVDELVRANEVYAYLDKSVLNTGSPATVNPPGYNPALGHARGHLLANVLGGSGTDLRNVTPIFHRTVNNSVMKKIENDVRRILPRPARINSSGFPGLR